MKGVLRQRLVGALVIIALGLIFWPVIFVDNSRAPLDRNSQVPAMPEVGRAPIPAPEPLRDMDPALDDPTIDIVLHDAPPDALDDPAPGGKTSNAQTPENAAGGEGRSSPPTLDGSGVPEAWILRVIVVSEKARADALVQQLIDDGHKAAQRPLRRSAGGRLVYVGPVLDRAALDSAQAAIDRKLGVETIIERYSP